MPVALQDWLPPERLAYFISDVVDHLAFLRSWADMRMKSEAIALPSAGDTSDSEPMGLLGLRMAPKKAKRG